MSREQHQNKVQAAAQELLAFSQDYAIIRQLQSPMGALGEQISAQNKQLNTLNRAKAKGNLSLAEFLPAKLRCLAMQKLLDPTGTPRVFRA
jgi:hypothetical protein